MDSQNNLNKEIVSMNKALAIILSAVVGTVSFVGGGMYVGLQVINDKPILAQTVYAKDEPQAENTVMKVDGQILDEQGKKDFTIPFKVLTKSETGKLNLRKHSNKNAEILAEIKDGADVISNGEEYLDKADNITWVNVKWGDNIGWVSKDYLSTQENYEQAVSKRQAEKLAAAVAKASVSKPKVTSTTKPKSATSQPTPVASVTTTPSVSSAPAASAATPSAPSTAQEDIKYKTPTSVAGDWKNTDTSLIDYYMFDSDGNYVKKAQNTVTEVGTYNLSGDTLITIPDDSNIKSSDYQASISEDENYLKLNIQVYERTDQ